MRTEKEVIQHLLDFAKSEERVRAVIFNGSRVNPNAPEDFFRDYDIVFSVTDPDYYLKNQWWIEQFGDLAIMQQNNAEIGGRKKYIFLLQFKDGLRIDLNFNPVKSIVETIESDSLTRVLLDKDNLIGQLPPPDERTYYVKKPSESEFDMLLNEAWWIQTYVAKGIWRDEYPLARYMYDVILQETIVKLLSWYVGMQHDWKVNVGKCGKWLDRYLPAEIFNEFKATYSGRDYEQIWEALFNSGTLIRKVGTVVAEKLEYKYPLQEDINVTRFISRIKELSRDAESFD